MTTKLSNSQELVQYLTDTKKVMMEIRNHAESRNKTLKFLACKATMDVFIMRIDGALCAAKTGNGEDLNVGPIQVQRKIYDSICEFWAQEMLK